jgi:SAM-dependent methyltransferase
MSVFTEENGFVLDGDIGYNERRRNRLEWRYRAFIQPIAGRLGGKKVLDLASHDGRWTFACLLNGAAHVTAVEIRQELLDKARRSITLPQMRDRVRFVAADVFDALPRLFDDGDRFDTILCLGLFYHVMDHHRLMKLMTAFKPELIVMDTSLIDSDDAYVLLKTERGATPRSAALDFHRQKEVATGIVSRGGMRMLANSFGYRIFWVDWESVGVDTRYGLGEYLRNGPSNRRRYSFYLEPDPGLLATAEPRGKRRVRRGRRSLLRQSDGTQPARARRRRRGAGAIESRAGASGSEAGLVTEGPRDQAADAEEYER